VFRQVKVDVAHPMVNPTIVSWIHDDGVQLLSLGACASGLFGTCAADPITQSTNGTEPTVRQ
jgi:hypothetical protein